MLAFGVLIPDSKVGCAGYESCARIVPWEAAI